METTSALIWGSIVDRSNLVWALVWLTLMTMLCRARQLDNLFNSCNAIDALDLQRLKPLQGSYYRVSLVNVPFGGSY